MSLPFVPLAHPPTPTAGGGSSKEVLNQADACELVAAFVAAIAPEPVPLGELVVEMSAKENDASITLSFETDPASSSTIDLMQAFSPHALGEKGADGKMPPPPAGPRRLVELLYEIEIARLNAAIGAHASDADQRRASYDRLLRHDLIEAQGFFGVRGDVPGHPDNEDWKELEKELGREEQKPQSTRTTRRNTASASKAVAASAAAPYDGGAFKVKWTLDKADRLTAITANIRNDIYDVLRKSYHFFGVWFDGNPVGYERPPIRMYATTSDSDEADAAYGSTAEEVNAFEDTFLQSLTAGVFEAYEDAFGARANFRFVAWRRDEKTPFRVERHRGRHGDEYGKMKYKYRVSVAVQDLTGVPCRQVAAALRKVRDARPDDAGPSAA